MPTPEQFVAVVAAILITIVAAAFKASGIGDPEKSWVEFALSLVVAYVGLVVTGTIPFLPSVGVDPLTWASALGQFLGVIFTLAYVVYNLFTSQIKTAGLKLARK